MNREQRQDLDAEFSAFVVTKGRQLLRLAELLTGDPHRAADIVQSALERAYPHWRRINADDPTAYVRRIVVNQHRDWWRRLRNRELPADLSWVEPADPTDMTERHAQRALVLGALAQLTARERTVVVLRYYGDLSEARIAAELGIAVGTVKSTLHRALAKLRALPELVGRLPEENAAPCTKSEVSV
ncbi:RNA polymerase sigma-E factor [Kitasatospora herbaricolor]|uniref:SigE family RNA polymerase sigma factor n=1 Tax=Kitasatospora herbaricolor TaxID=68217 RepID=UPI00174EB4B7|nr:SigE family RNA polymerase sigma factor [Kitasatospora herbaricolor]MDQ0311121.1 RNA polymerase sigma-70 factor (sigma-E family) [Kitasatospora herbaricolor]GGV11877.1 RNA polymerase sigma-E factor [Kitasatospora herbaricolor]